MRLDESQSDLPLVGLVALDLVPQLTSYYWDSFDAKCLLAVKIVHSIMVTLMQFLRKIKNLLNQFGERL